MRPLRVVVLDEEAQDALEVAAVEDQQPVETFDADGSDETLGDGVCLRRPQRRLDDPDATAAEDLVEGAAVFAVAVADQEAHAVVGEVEAEVACLLGHPGLCGVGRAAGQPDAPACARDEEQHVVPAQEHTVDGEEVACDDARRLGAQELAPTRTRPPRGRPQPGAGEQPATVDGDTSNPSLASSPLIRRWPQRGFFRASRSTRARTSPGMGGRPRCTGGCRHFLRTSARCQRSRVRGVTRRAPRGEGGRWQAAAASSARSTPRRCGRASWRRRTSSAGPAARRPLRPGHGDTERVPQAEP
jgi:hypothetical protein